MVRAMSLPEPRIDVRVVGRDREPVVVIDGFSGQAAELRAAGERLAYAPMGASYPGVRAQTGSELIDARAELLVAVVRKVFGARRGFRLQGCAYSLVTHAPADLHPLQRIPHYDVAEADMVAGMFYFSEADGGTAFYRHRATGYEAITPEREPHYNSALKEEVAAKGLPDARYMAGDDARFEQIGAVEAKPDRFALYRGRLLHSGIIPEPEALSDNPAHGRLTLNSFMMLG